MAVFALLALCESATNAQSNSTLRQRMVETGLTTAVPAGTKPATYTVRDRMDRYSVPGLSLAVIDRGRIDWTAAYGTTRQRGPTAVTAATRFQAASLSKLVTATGALRMVERGRLRLDAPVHPDFAGWTDYPGNSAPPTLRSLLSHTAGIAPVGFQGYAPATALPSLPQILAGIPPANSPTVTQRYAPGGYRYSGGGYELVEWLVERAGGTPFPDTMLRLVLAPLGMRQSTFATRRADRDRSPVALGHGYDGQPIAGGWRDYPEHAAASLWSTPADLARLAIGIARSWRDERPGLLTKVTARDMLTPIVPGAGLGPGVHGQGDRLYFDHAGSNRGYRAYLIMYPATGNGVVVMANHDNADLLIGEVVRAVAAAYGWPDFRPTPRPNVPLSSAALDAFTGTYTVKGEAAFDLTLTRRDDHLLLSTPRGSSYEFYPSSPTQFFATEDGAELGIATSPDGVVTLNLWGLTATRR